MTKSVFIIQDTLFKVFYEIIYNNMKYNFTDVLAVGNTCHVDQFFFVSCRCRRSRQPQETTEIQQQQQRSALSES